MSDHLVESAFIQQEPHPDVLVLEYSHFLFIYNYSTVFQDTYRFFFHHCSSKTAAVNCGFYL